MTHDELIERLQIDASAVSAFHMYIVQNDCLAAADSLAAADKRIAELEEERPISHDDWYEMCNKYDAAAQKAAELSIRCDEAERKLAVAREALQKIGEIASPYRDGVKFNYIADVAQEALAQIGGDDAAR